MYKFINCHNGHFFKCYYINGEEHILLWFFFVILAMTQTVQKSLMQQLLSQKQQPPLPNVFLWICPKKGLQRRNIIAVSPSFSFSLLLACEPSFFDYYSSLIHCAHFEYDFIYYGFTRSLFIWVFWKKVWLYWKMISSYACITKNLILFMNYWLVSYFSIGNIDHTHAYSNKVSLPTRKYCRHIIRYILSFQNI